MRTWHGSNRPGLGGQRGWACPTRTLTFPSTHTHTHDVSLSPSLSSPHSLGSLSESPRQSLPALVKGIGMSSGVDGDARGCGHIPNSYPPAWKSPNGHNESNGPPALATPTKQGPPPAARPASARAAPRQQGRGQRLKHACRTQRPWCPSHSSSHRSCSHASC
jgi:hypothetical protein